MSSSRRSRQASSSSRINDDQITDLISKLRQSIPEIRQNRRSNTVKSFIILTIYVYIYVQKLAYTTSWNNAL
ncbi:hypothetical protein Bca52824_005075 [Brassica carinata]|uniref:BHLH domain-containing protein n=1 Tax=Brassica carinata TaxID=52824 RepID=A0A8X8BGA0_BRACI|nr:hypothetical protein Bca52824_005075 [Brassica carinata]